MLINLLKLFLHLGYLFLVQVDLLVQIVNLLSLGLLPIHLLQVLHFNIFILLLCFSKPLTLLIFDKLDLLIVQSIQLPLFVVIRPNYVELLLRFLHLSVKTLRSQ